MKNRRMSFTDACNIYVHRFTMEHVPSWAETPFTTGEYPAPQWATDAEWYHAHTFPGDNIASHKLHGNAKHCEGRSDKLPTWPLGKSLTAPYVKGSRQ
jgi:hypothetical protein